MLISTNWISEAAKISGSTNYGYAAVIFNKGEKVQLTAIKNIAINLAFWSAYTVSASILALLYKPTDFLTALLSQRFPYLTIFSYFKTSVIKSHLIFHIWLATALPDDGVAPYPCDGVPAPPDVGGEQDKNL